MTAPLRMLTWDQLAAARPDMVATMRAYLTQIGCVLRPGSVMGADQALRSLAQFLLAEHPHIEQVAQIDRPQAHREQRTT